VPAASRIDMNVTGNLCYETTRTIVGFLAGDAVVPVPALGCVSGTVEPRRSPGGDPARRCFVRIPVWYQGGTRLNSDVALMARRNPPAFAENEWHRHHR
jgi:hypothetical protein